MRLLCVLIALLAGLIGPTTMAAASVLVVSAGGTTRQFTSDELLARHDAATLAVSNDPAYGGAMSYLHVRLRRSFLLQPHLQATLRRNPIGSSIGIVRDI
jgi:hypothetical protein